MKNFELFQDRRKEFEIRENFLYKKKERKGSFSE
jgi:hypothetical protein